MLAAYNQFIESESQQNSNFAFWSSYIKMVGELLLFTRATCEGNWSLNLSAVQNMLLWYFCYNRMNYSHYLSAYYLKMCDLQTTHPDIHENLYLESFVFRGKAVMDSL